MWIITVGTLFTFYKYERTLKNEPLLKNHWNNLYFNISSHVNETFLFLLFFFILIFDDEMVVNKVYCAITIRFIFFYIFFYFLLYFGICWWTFCYGGWSQITAPTLMSRAQMASTAWVVLPSQLPWQVPSALFTFLFWVNKSFSALVIFLQSTILSSHFPRLRFSSFLLWNWSIFQVISVTIR